jgi:hypothetical protein
MNDPSRWARWTMRGRRLLVILLLFVIVVLVIRAVFDVWEGRRLNEEIASLGKRYGSLDDWHIGPPQVARAENRARVLAAAASSLTTSASDLDAALNALRRSPANVTGDQAKKIVAENRDAIELAIRAARRPHSNWQIAYDHREWANVPPLLDLRQLSQVLALAAREDAAAGRADDAAADVAAGFAEAASLRGEPNTIIMLIAIAIADAQVEALQQVLVRSDPSSAALAALASAVDENLVEHPMRPAMIAELKLARSLWSRIERGQLEGLDPSKPTPVWMAGVVWLFRPVVRFVARRDLADLASAVDAASTPRSRRAAIVMHPRASEAPWWSPRRWLMLAGLSIEGYWGYPSTQRLEAADAATAVVRLSAVAVALRRFRLDHGAYPDSLDELAPAYLKAVPLDPFTGRQLEYARQGAGFELRAHVPAAKRALGEWNVPR